MTNTIRVAAAQFHVGDDVHKNLASCLRMMREASIKKPDLLVLPEFSNHCSWYNDADHCYSVSVDLDGEFMQAIAECTREIGAHVVINCTVRAKGLRVTGTSIMLAPDGSIIGTTNKQVLIGHENDFLDPATEAGPVMDTDLGRLAMYSCMDGVINETPRCLALRGAEVLCNSLNSFAIDEGSLHIPVRAAENKVWVVAANKVGPLIPEALVAPVSEATSIPAHFLNGAGDSQIVAPDGTVIAVAGKGEEIIVADIAPDEANNKTRKDGTDIFASRRPELYGSLADDPASQQITIDGPEDVIAAAVAIENAGDFVEIASKISAAQDMGAKLICLSSNACSNASEEEVVANISAVISGDTLVAASATNTAVLIGNNGAILRQRQLHSGSQCASSDSVQFVDTDFGRLAVLTDKDIIYPETIRLAALQSVSTVLVPAALQEEWEGRTGVIERAAENRVNIVLASQGCGDRASVIASLQKDFTIMTEWKNRPFDGLLSCPEFERASDGNSILTKEIHPLAASNKECSRNTHLLDARPWRMLQAIVDSAVHPTIDRA
jgi:predicted amidohydrolase